VSQKILIVDDDEDIRRLLNMRLRTQEYQTVFASDGTNALAIARRERPDLVLLDLGLPGGDGFSVMERMRHLADLQMTPVVVVSARVDPMTKQLALEAGAAAFVGKPVDKDELFAAIDSALAAS
jgi:two-component system, cell cycle response regulator